MVDDLKSQIDKLSVSEKILLVEEIWDSIANEEKSFEITENQKRTVLRRSKELKENPSFGRSCEEIRDEFLGNK